MPTKSFALEKGGPERVEVQWRGNFKDFEVRLDGNLIGSFENAKELKTGKTFPLEDGSRLEVGLKPTGLGVPELTLLRNGQPLPGSATDPAQRVGAAAGMIFVVAGLNAILGLVALAFNVQFLQSLGIGGASIFVGAIYGVLGYFVKRQSFVALALAVGLFVLDGLALLFNVPPGGTPPIGGILARFFFLIPMVMGFPALKALQEEEDRAQRAPRPRPPRAMGTAASSGTAGQARPAGQGPAATDAASGPEATAAAPGSARAAASSAPAARTFTGDAERRRLELSQTASAVTTRTAPSGQRKETRTKDDVDTAASGLRFVARKCEITPTGLKVQNPDGRSREVGYAEIAALVVRLLPPDPPWNAAPILDAVVRSADNTAWEAVRVFSTTIVNTAALPGGGSTSRLENMRRLGGHLAAQNPAISLDAETAAFVNDGKPPSRFVNTTHFADYDLRYR
jgi:hypothetical protein